MGRPPCCDKSNVKRGLWTAEEDAKILAHVSKHGTGNWTLVPKKAGLNRCGKSCRLRWTNYLRPDLNHDDFTSQEEDHIINLHQIVGSRWSLIAKQLPGRTDNDVKNYWNTKLRKKLSKMGIDPLTHKPFSQIFSEFGSISAAANATHHAPVLPEPVVSGQFLHHQGGFFSDQTTISPACSSTSSSSLSCQQSGPAQMVEWSDFLVNEPCQLISAGEPTAQLEREGMLFLGSGSTAHLEDYLMSSDGIENSSVNSFVEAILDRDNELRSSFPEFLDESFEYF